MIDRMNKSLFVFISIVLLTGIDLPAQNPYIQHFTTKDGLPSNTAYPVYCDSKKFLWFGTDAGVARYDGNEFTCFSKKDGLNSNEIIIIKEDLQGRIWLVNLNGSMNYFYQNKIYNKNNAPFLEDLDSKHFFRDFFQDTDSTIYFYTFKSLEIVALNTLNQVKKFLLPSISKTYNGIETDLMSVRFITRFSGEIIRLYTSAGIYALHDFTQEPRLVSGTFSFDKCFMLNTNKFLLQAYNESDSTRWLFEYINDTLHPPVKDPLNYPRHFSSAIETDRKVLWISTRERGVFCIRNNVIINHINIAEAQGMAQDHEGNIWINTINHGVYKFSPYYITHEHYGPEFFNNAGITNLCPYGDQGVWMTNSNRVYLLKDHEFYTLNFSTDESSYDQLYFLKNNSLIIGKGSYKFFYFTDIEPLESARLIKHSKLQKISHCGNLKSIAISPLTGKMYAYIPNHLISFSNELYFGEEDITHIDERIHNIFFNLDDELVVNAKKNYIFRDGTFIPNEKLSEFDNKIITGHLRINDSIEVYNVDGDSIYLSCRHLIFNLTQALNKPIDMMVKKMAYHEPSLYLSTLQNVFICDFPENIHDGQSVDLRLIDINFREVNDLLVFNDSLYVASDDGLTIIPEAGISQMNLHVPIPYLQSVQVNGTDINLAKQEIKISGKSKVRFSFSCINYSAAPIIYSYQLAGIDTSWNIGTAREVVYQNLSKGSYVFRVKAQKPGSGFSLPVDFKIEVTATLWERPLFYIGVLMLIAGWILWSAHRRQKRKRLLLEMDIQLITLEQKALQSMMNPHFIFNVLGSIQNYILQSKPAEAGLYLSQFARLIRQNLNAINANMIDLEEEIDRLKNYLDLERLRMENKFDYKIEFEEGFDEEEELLIPSMIVQPFVENAVWHGISNISGKGMISVSLGQQAQDTVRITVEDNGVGMKSATRHISKSEQHLNLGVEMTRKRLEILGKKLGVKTSISYYEKAKGSHNPGTRVVLVVPVG
ncbi:MAG: hypothetical protein B6I19_04875 [Bacteroidetes bacterium 4572_114]|nr:MAG: hypothetical protein B6I19_04875 [Bacteroidetes bacterium 4572_114]